jgi:hypothetical protein
MNSKATCIGGLGGMLGQMIICFHAVYKYWNQEFNILDPKVV